jgi:glycosyltransferase involved in cell wall biosynthesis
MRTIYGLGAFKLWWSRQRLANAISMRRGLTELNRRYRFDVIEMPECGAEGALIASQVDSPTVVRLHSPSHLIMPYYDVNKADIRLCRAIERRALDRATALTACSGFVARQAADQMGLDRPITVIPNGIDPQWLNGFYGGTNSQLQFGIPVGVPVVLFTGRMERRKGVHLLPAVAAALLERHEVALVLAGSDLFGYVERTLLPSLEGRRLRGSIHPLGAVSLAAIRGLVTSADIVLLPSLWENCPYACLEAMGLGKPVVGSDQGGMPELINHGVNGQLARVDDADAFVAAVEEMLASPYRRQAIGEAAKSTIRDSHNALDLARETVDLYESLRLGSSNQS